MSDTKTNGFIEWGKAQFEKAKAAWCAVAVVAALLGYQVTATPVIDHGEKLDQIEAVVIENQKEVKSLLSDYIELMEKNINNVSSQDEEAKRKFEELLNKTSN